MLKLSELSGFSWKCEKAKMKMIQINSVIIGHFPGNAPIILIITIMLMSKATHMVSMMAVCLLVEYIYLLENYVHNHLFPQKIPLSLLTVNFSILIRDGSTVSSGDRSESH